MYDLDEIQNKRGLHIAHLNVRSMVNKWDNIKANFMDSGIHVLSFSETWLHTLLPDNNFCLGTNYTLLRNDRKWNDANDINCPPKKGGGTCIYINNKLDFSDNDFSRFNTSTINLEAQWVSILQKPNKTILIGNLYRPPQGNASECIDLLENILTSINADKIEIILMGDLNLDLHDNNIRPAKELLSTLKQLGLRQLIKEPTRYSQNKDSCLDLFFTNSDIIERSGVCNVNISDHQMILLTRKKAKFIKLKCDFNGRSYRNYDAAILQDRIKNSNWDFLNSTDSLEIQWDKWLDIITKEMNIMCPIKTFRIKQIKQPWITPRLLELIKDKDKALKTAKKSKNPDLWIEAKRLRNACTNRLRKAKADFIKEQLVTHSNDQKKFWKHIQDVLPTKTHNNKPITLLDDNNQIVETENVSDYINQFFTNIGPNLAKDCQLEWNFPGEDCIGSLSDIETTKNEIIEICKSISINKASCVDSVSSEVLRDVFLAVPDKLCTFFNNCFRLSAIPNSWKYARVTPLPKGGNDQIVSNYRPISLLPLLSKIIEKIVHKRIYAFLTEYDILDDRQGGFRPDHSTVKTCAYFTEDIYTAINNKETTIAVFIDAMKAFDTVNHKILLKKLQKIGIKGALLEWLKNYLTNRKQCTVANNIVSPYRDITYGVPQGSVLGPLLFLIYINDLSNIIKNSKISMYADDTVIYISHSNLNIAITLIQSDLNALYEWCNRNKLTINCKKTKFCLFGMRSNIKRSKMLNIQLSLNANILERVCSYKYLGLTLDEHLNYNKHVKEMSKLISHKLYLLSKIRRYITQFACINIFKTMVLSVIEYCDIVYAGTTQLNLSKLDNLFYRGLRICTNDNTSISRKVLCNNHAIAPLTHRRDTHLLLFMHKQTNKNYLLKEKKVNTRLQKGPVFKTFKPNNEKAKLSVFYRGANSWNALRADTRNMSFTDFKLYQKKQLYSFSLLNN